MQPSLSDGAAQNERLSPDYGPRPGVRTRRVADPACPHRDGALAPAWHDRSAAGGCHTRPQCPRRTRPRPVVRAVRHRRLAVHHVFSRARDRPRRAQALPHAQPRLRPAHLRHSARCGHAGGVLRPRLQPACSDSARKPVRIAHTAGVPGHPTARHRTQSSRHHCHRRHDHHRHPRPARTRRDRRVNTWRHWGLLLAHAGRQPRALWRDRAVRPAQARTLVLPQCRTQRGVGVRLRAVNGVRLRRHGAPCRFGTDCRRLSRRPCAEPADPAQQRTHEPDPIHRRSDLHPLLPAFGRHAARCQRACRRRALTVDHARHAHLRAGDKVACRRRHSRVARLQPRAGRPCIRSERRSGRGYAGGNHRRLRSGPFRRCGGQRRDHDDAGDLHRRPPAGRSPRPQDRPPECKQRQRGDRLEATHPRQPVQSCATQGLARPGDDAARTGPAAAHIPVRRSSRTGRTRTKRS
ncbi:hypothetical protein TMEC54S_03721 [Thauera mechernichensis]